MKLVLGNVTTLAADKRATFHGIRLRLIKFTTLSHVNPYHQIVKNNNRALLSRKRFFSPDNCQYVVVDVALQGRNERQCSNRFSQKIRASASGTLITELTLETGKG